MRTPNRAIAMSLLVVYTCALVPTSASAQATAPQTATVVANTPIYIGASVSPTPLRVAAPGTILKVLQLQEEWVQVEFNDPQWGRRVGWVERPLLKLGADELQPMDLSVQDTDRPPPEPARFSKPQPPPQAQQFVAHSARQPRGDETMAAGVLEGEMLAEGTSTGGKLALGLGVGLLTGLIGTGIGYRRTGSDVGRGSPTLFQPGPGLSVGTEDGMGEEEPVEETNCVSCWWASGHRRTGSDRRLSPEPGQLLLMHRRGGASRVTAGVTRHCVGEFPVVYRSLPRHVLSSFPLLWRSGARTRQSSAR
jgi:hypothetical protein